MAASITYQFSNQDLDRALAGLAAQIVGAVTLFQQTHQYLTQTITQANLDAGMLITLGGPDVAPWSPELFDHYNYSIAQAYGILQALVTGTPPPIEVVQAWSAQFHA